MLGYVTCERDPWVILIDVFIGKLFCKLFRLDWTTQRFVQPRCENSQRELGTFLIEF